MNTTIATAAAPLPAQPAPGAQPPAPAMGPDPFALNAASTMAGPTLAAVGGGYAVQQTAVVQQSAVQAGGPLPADAAVAGASFQQQLIPVLSGLVNVLGQLVASVGGGGPVQALDAAGGGAVACDTPQGPTQSPVQQVPVAQPFSGGGVVSVPTAGAVPPVGAQPAPPTMPMPASTPAPVPAPTPTAGGGPVPTVDPARITGTPAPDGLINFLVASAQANAPAAMHELGYWMQIPDGPSGASIQAHVHGRYAQSPQLLAEAVQRGEVAVHVHPDGTLHIHDLV